MGGGKVMEAKECPICGRTIYGRAGSFRCPIHGCFKFDWVNKELVSEDPCKECPYNKKEEDR